MLGTVLDFLARVQDPLGNNEDKVREYSKGEQ